MSAFGCAYPAGAENDPNAPWNAVEMEVSCSECGHVTCEQLEGEECEECGEGGMQEYEPAEPCRCHGDCYC